MSGSELRIADKPPTIFHLDPQADASHKFEAEHVFSLYRDCLSADRRHILDRHKMVDLAFKAVGVGSVGTFCLVALLMTGDGEPLFLQLKQAQRSALERPGGGLV